jgi:hypothetical protein
MKRIGLRRVVLALFASVVLGVSLPSLAAAQASGGNTPIGVTVPKGQPLPVQLPRTGNPDAESSSSVPGLFIGAGAILALFAFRGRRLRGALRRRRQ